MFTLTNDTYMHIRITTRTSTTDATESKINQKYYRKHEVLLPQASSIIDNNVDAPPMGHWVISRDCNQDYAKIFADANSVRMIMHGKGRQLDSPVNLDSSRSPRE